MNWKEFGLSWLQRYAADIVLALIGGRLKDMPRERLEGWLVRFGKAFGPANLRHFSELSQEEKQELLDRVPVLMEPHHDWPNALRWVPRTLTVWIGPAPTMDDVIDGEISGELKPIPKNGEWYVSNGYMASTTIDGVHDRFGFRYDDVDQYFTLSAALKIV